ncbi:hypothetical protein GCM10009019_01740 [Salarchaeum japonicum]|uniref:Uncharacterized protein n=1 Tax=Salarchaeum japonicum TaxID=555573 RepID=A0AAV3SWS7_9EURY
MPLKNATATQTTAVRPSTATTPGTRHAAPFATEMAAVARLSANSVQTAAVVARATPEADGVVSGSCTESFARECPVIVRVPAARADTPAIPGES